MSNALALAATTATLVNLLVEATPNVTALPPDKAHDEGVDEQLNIFLYHVGLAAGWRNTGPVGAPGESGPSPLPLVLSYLVTAYAGTEVRAHALLGAAMGVLHDRPVLGSAEILDATSGPLPTADLHLQAERVRITPLPVGLHDLSELWSGLSTHLRISQAYEVGPVLLTSTRPRPSPLPVLRQGPGPGAPLALAGPDAVLEAVLPATGAVAVLGGRVRVLGTGLDRVTGVRFRTRRLPEPTVLPPATGRTDRELAVDLPDVANGLDSWVAGVHDVSLVSEHPSVPRLVSNIRSVGIGPLITVSPQEAPAGDVTLVLTCRPRLRADQEVTAVLGTGTPLVPDTVETPVAADEPSEVTVTVRDVPAGIHVVRLRVDGVDSDPVRYVGDPPVPEFDPAAQVVVT